MSPLFIPPHTPPLKSHPLPSPLPRPFRTPSRPPQPLPRRNARPSPPPTMSLPASPLPPPTAVHVEFAPGKALRFETGRIARHAAGAVNVRFGGTLLLCTACAQSSPDCPDFLPLRVDFTEKFSAAGRTSGSYIKREGRPSDREILVARLVDRSLRPMFEPGYFDDVQLLATVFSYDGLHRPDALAICAASAALHVSDIPLAAPVAAVRMGWDGQCWHVEPRAHPLSAEMVVAGCANGLVMIDGWGDFVEEPVLLQGVKMASRPIHAICQAIEQLREKTGRVEKIKERRVVAMQIKEQVASLAWGIRDALTVVKKKERDRQVELIRQRVFADFKSGSGEGPQDQESVLLKMAWKEMLEKEMKRLIVDNKMRLDGRGPDAIRPITIDLAPLPCVHGSCLFTRGETQTLAVATIGGEEMVQRFETLEGEGAARFYLHYSFPPFSVGEVGRLGTPGRREIGHGKLAEKALAVAMPSLEEFPYVVRVESNITESNGSSSMASVCGGCIALVEAGIPLKSLVAGVAMGVIMDDEKGANWQGGEGGDAAVVLTDILGVEDALGSCDAKFAGNKRGISALQLDIKLQGISVELFERIMMRAKEARARVIDCMEAAVPLNKRSLPDSVPKVKVIRIPPKRVGEMIGPGGKTVRSIIDRCGGEEVTRISANSDGRVVVSSSQVALVDRAIDLIGTVTRKFDVGTTLTGTVTKILPFGAYVEIAKGKEGWLHISELENERTNNVEDVCSVGDNIEVKIMEVGQGGQIRVSRKACLHK